MSLRLIIRLTTSLVAVLLLGVGTVGVYGLYRVLATPLNVLPTEARLPTVSTGNFVDAATYEIPVPELEQGEGKPSEISGSWPWFRGPSRDNIHHDAPPLLRGFPDEAGMKNRLRWSVDMGEGFAGPTVRDGRVYVLDYDVEKRCDALRCLSLDDGREIWRFSYPVVVKRNHGMSRSIPAVTEKYCFTIGPMLHTACVDRLTGEQKWFLDVKHRFNVTEPEWYSGQCPLVVNNPQLNGGRDTLIMAVGVSAPGTGEGVDTQGDALLLALDGETGSEIWRTPNPFGWSVTHSSPMPMELDGRETYVYCGKGGVVGVDGKDGRILWSSTDWKIQIATCPSPVVLPENRIFFSGGYESGSLMMKIETGGTGDAYTAKTLFTLKSPAFGSEQQTPLFHDGHLFGIRQRDKAFVCLSTEGKIVWDTGRGKRRFGLGPYLLADGMFLILDDDGILTLCEASTTEYRPFDEREVVSHNGWGPMAMVGSLLLLRDENRMSCLDLAR